MKEDSLVQFKLMLPAALKARVETAAKENRRSLSQEIVGTLEEKYPSRDTMIAEIEAKLKDLRQMEAEGRMQFRDAEGNLLSTDEVVQALFNGLASAKDANVPFPKPWFTIEKPSR